MVILVCFDLPRHTKLERRQAAQYQKRLVELGFSMKQYSLYEREVRNFSTQERLIKVLRNELPDSGAISVYMLPDSVNDSQITILGENAVMKTVRKPRILYL